MYFATTLLAALSASTLTTSLPTNTNTTTDPFAYTEAQEAGIEKRGTYGWVTNYAMTGMFPPFFPYPLPPYPSSLAPLSLPFLPPFPSFFHPPPPPPVSQPPPPTNSPPSTDPLCTKGWGGIRPKIHQKCVPFPSISGRVGINWGTYPDAFDALDYYSDAHCLVKLGTIKA